MYQCDHFFLFSTCLKVNLETFHSKIYFLCFNNIKSKQGKTNFNKKKFKKKIKPSF